MKPIRHICEKCIAAYGMAMGYGSKHADECLQAMNDRMSRGKCALLMPVDIVSVLTGRQGMVSLTPHHDGGVEVDGVPEQCEYTAEHAVCQEVES